MVSFSGAGHPDRFGSSELTSGYLGYLSQLGSHQMLEVQVMTDSVSSISSELAKEYNIRVIPAANIVFDGHLYPDGIGMSASQAYQFLEQDPDKFSASTLSPSDLIGYFRDAGRENNNIVHISFSSALSGTSQLASVAAEQVHREEPHINIRVIDSKTAAGAQGLLAIVAARAASMGMDLEQVVNVIDRARQKTEGIMMLDTMRYVYRTGRISKTAAKLFSVLNIKPINRMTSNGTLEVVDRVRKREAGYQKLISLIKKEAGTDSLHFIVSHANAPEIGVRISELLKQEFHCLSLAITQYSPIMGYATGPGCIFIGFQPELDLQNQ
jgi:DegV family protein with EDD domain